jgi:hypothetical protein
MRRSLLLTLPLLVALATPARARELAIESFDADIRVEAGGGVVVTETIRPRFTGAWNGLYRTLPVDYRTAAGLGHKLLLRVLGARDGPGGRALRWETSREGRHVKVKVWVPDARDATRTVVLRYRVRNALGFFADHDELYWNVTGEEWEAPIERATVRVALPAGAEGVRAVAYAGTRLGRNRDADVEVAGSEVRFRAHRALPPGQGLTIVVGWPKGLVRAPGALARATAFLLGNWPLAVPAALLPLLLLAWARWGRDPRLGPIAVAYSPPADLTPAEAGALLDHRADARDVSATLVDLAVRGFLRIEKSAGGEWVFHRAPGGAGPELAAHERRLLEALFADGETTLLSALENRFHHHLEKIRGLVFDRLLERGCYRARPSRVRHGWHTAGVFAGILLACGSGLPLGGLAVPPPVFIAGGILTAALVGAFALVMPTRTREGTRVLGAVVGFREFLSRVEGDRLARTKLEPALFERFLPWAMALGVERQWASAFDDLWRTPPTWYDGPGQPRFSASDLTHDLRGLSTRTAAVFASTPASTGDSGFGGGGSVGGGSGGGGGGGF